jgi:hypothetical protein
MAKKTGGMLREAEVVVLDEASASAGC